MNVRYYLFCELLATLWLVSCSTAVESPPEVVTIYPTSDTLPENLLRMYIQFSSPMKTVGNLEKIQLVDSQGKEVKGAIFNNVYELWNAEQTQLTLIFDPARVKKGLQVYDSLGPALLVGREYQLLIEGLEDVTHLPLAESFLKTFVVSAPDTVPPNPGNWELAEPKAGSRTPLFITFPTILDQMSLNTRILILNDRGEEVLGDIKVGELEKSIAYVPEVKWQKGQYHIMVHTRLEDPAGNNIRGLFDHPVGSLRGDHEEETLDLAFQVE
ncbi:MAG: hypothetical protein AAF655_11490 [Bacteroidota bacterium]